MQTQTKIFVSHRQPLCHALHPLRPLRSCRHPQQQHQRPRVLQQARQHPARPRPCRVVLTSHADPLAASIVAAAEPAGLSPSQFVPPLSKQQLLDIAASFVRLWFAGIAKGPQAVEQELAELLAPDVVIKADRVKHFKDTEGLHEVLAELERAHLEYHRSEHRPMLYSASPDVQRAYSLVEGTYQDVGALPGHPATFRISKVHHILSMQVEHGRIAVLWLYRQLTEEDKDDLLHEPLACYPAPFPRDSLLLADAAQHASQSSKMADAVRAWWQVWVSGPMQSSSSSTPLGGSGSSGGGSNISSGGGASTSSSSPPARTRLRSRDRGSAGAQLLAPDFRMWDAYGLWPAMRAQGRRYLNKDAALRYLQALSYSYHIELTVLDVAAAEGSLACFSHWQAKLVPRWQDQANSSSVRSLESVEAAEAAAGSASAAGGAAGAAPAQQGATSSMPAVGQQAQVQPDGALLVDGMAVDLFNEDMQLKVVWMFRGPITSQEWHLFLEYDKQLAAAEAALANSEQEAIRATRRAQREQQLAELLAWMNSYQSQWSEYVSHVQKQIARQQRLAKQELIRQLQESQSLEASIEEEELQQQQSEFGLQMQQQLVQAQQQLLNLQQQAQQQLQSFRQQQADNENKGSSSD